MTTSVELLNGLSRIAAQEASIPALRTGLFLLAVLAAWAWFHSRPRLALAVLATGGVLGLGYWLIQIEGPFGLGTDVVLTRQWAQAGVNSAAEPKDMGFVVGTPRETSLISMLALAGLPRHLVRSVPQISVLACLAVLLVLPLRLIRNRTTKAFASCLTLGGGLWPGISPYAGALRHHSGFAAAFLILGVSLAILATGSGIQRRLHHSRLGLSVVLISLAALAGAIEGGAEPGIGAALLLVLATILLAPFLRGWLRRICAPPVPPRLAEALVILGVFAGSGLLWWDPPAGVAGFSEARNEAVALRKPMEWISQNVPPGSVVLSTPAYSASIAALAGRRVLFPPPIDPAPALPEPYRRSRLFESTLQGRPVARLAEAFSATHLFLGPGEPTPATGPVTEPDDEPRLRLIPVYEDARHFRVFLLARK